MDRDQSGTLTLRLLTGQPAEMHALQRVLEAAPSYYLTVTGRPPGNSEAQSLFTAIVAALHVMEKPLCRDSAA